MEYHVERVITHNEIQQRGEDAAVQNAVDNAWCMAVRNAHPRRSVVLVSVESQEHIIGSYRGTGYTYRYTFMIDEG